LTVGLGNWKRWWEEEVVRRGGKRWEEVRRGEKRWEEVGRGGYTRD
jgi:hypothetical protein